MFGRKCTLCGGNLNASGVCTECGLNNKRNSAHNYHVNKNSCESAPLIHMHSTQEIERQQKRKEIEIQKTQKKAGKRRGAFGTVIILFIVFSLLSSIVDMFSSGNIENKMNEVIGNKANEIIGDVTGTSTNDPYKNTGYTLWDNGETVTYELTSGYYIVGIDIPEGNYIATTENPFDVVRLRDRENNIYIYAYEEGDDAEYLNDLRFYQGALIQISSKTKVILESDNAQTADMEEKEDNPLTEKVRLSGKKQWVSGQDFEPGIYDVQRVTENGSGIKVEIYDGSDRIRSEYLSMGEYGSDGNSFKNMLLPEGSVLEVEDDAYEIVPSQKISITDGATFYQEE